MNKSFLELFRQNDEYLKERKPLDEKLQEIEEKKRKKIAEYDALISEVMGTINAIEQPECAHDICLHVRLTDNYMGDIYACPICGNFIILADSFFSTIINVDKELTTIELNSLLVSVRSKIATILKTNPDISLTDLRTLIDNSVNQDKGITK